MHTQIIEFFFSPAGIKIIFKKVYTLDLDNIWLKNVPNTSNNVSYLHPIDL